MLQNCMHINQILISKCITAQFASYQSILSLKRAHQLIKLTDEANKTLGFRIKGG